MLSIMGAAEAQQRIDALNKALSKMKSSTSEATRCCEQLTKRARHLDSLTSPASDASSMLSKTSNNLGATLVIMKDAREKFDTVRDCEPAIERLNRGVVELQNSKSEKGRKKARNNPFEDGNEKNSLSEQDVYSAAENMGVIRDAYEYFIERKHWRSTASVLASLERVHQMGVVSMCTLENLHLTEAGQACRLKRVVKQDGETNISSANETAAQVSHNMFISMYIYISFRLLTFSFSNILIHFYLFSIQSIL